MRYAILSDIHGNREALDAVLGKIDEIDVDKRVCLGDIVGYGAQPGYCVDKIRETCDLVVAGNHDYAALGKISIDYFNSHARQATLWTRDQLSEEQQEYLRAIPLVEVDRDATFVHGSLDSPELFDYIQTSYDAYLSMQQMSTRACFIGHSHVPVAFLLDSESETITYTIETEVILQGVDRAILNVGSVGQPRDNNPLASFAVYDDEALCCTIHRIAYDIESSAARIVEAGLPVFLAERLRVGR